jgi:hypothetical protein
VPRVVFKRLNVIKLRLAGRPGNKTEAAAAGERLARQQAGTPRNVADTLRRLRTARASPGLGEPSVASTLSLLQRKANALQEATRAAEAA